MIAGWMRVVGQVTAVVTCRSQTWLIAPITLQTRGLLPCSLFHGWKWSLIHSAWNPASSAARAWATSSAGPYSSVDRKYPMRIPRPVPGVRAGMRSTTLPRPRGELTASLFAALRAGGDFRGLPTKTTDEDAALALWVLHEL